MGRRAHRCLGVACRSPLERAGRADARGDARFSRAVAISQEKIHTLADFWPLTGSLLDGLRDDPKARQRWLGVQGRAALADVRAALAQADSFDEDGVGVALEAIVRRRAVKSPLRRPGTPFP